MTRVLLLEPDVVLAEIYCTALQNAGHTVSIATTAQAAIKEADVHKPDVVLLELQLTAHNGVEFLYEFRSYDDWLTVPVVIQTNVPEELLREGAQTLTKQLAIAAYLYKPKATLQQMVRAVSAAIGDMA